MICDLSCLKTTWLLTEVPWATQAWNGTSNLGTTGDFLVYQRLCKIPSLSSLDIGSTPPPVVTTRNIISIAKHPLVAKSPLAEKHRYRKHERTQPLLPFWCYTSSWVRSGSSLWFCLHFPAGQWCPASAHMLAGLPVSQSLGTYKSSLCCKGHAWSAETEGISHPFPWESTCFYCFLLLVHSCLCDKTMEQKSHRENLPISSTSGIQKCILNVLQHIIFLLQNKVKRV